MKHTSNSCNSYNKGVILITINIQPPPLINLNVICKGVSAGSVSTKDFMPAVIKKLQFQFSEIYYHNDSKIIISDRSTLKHIFNILVYVYIYIHIYVGVSNQIGNGSFYCHA